MRRVQSFSSVPLYSAALVVLFLASAATRDSRAEIRIAFDHQGGWGGGGWGGGGWGNGFGAGSWGANTVFSPDSQLVAISTGGHSVQFWDLRAGRKVFVLEPSDKPREDSWLGAYEFLGDGRTFAALFNVSRRHSPGDELRLFDVVARKPRIDINFGKYRPLNMRFSPDGATAILWLPASIVRPKGHPVKENFKVVAYDTATGQERKRLDTCGHYGDAAFSPDGKWLATGHAASGAKGQVYLWDAATLERRAVLNTHAGLVSLVFSPDSKSLATAIQRGRDVAPTTSPPGVRLWDVESRGERGWLPGILVEDQAWSIVHPLFAPQGKFLVVSCSSTPSKQSHLQQLETQIKLWNTTDGSEMLLDRPGSNNPAKDGWWHACSTAFSPDGSILATPDPDSPASVKFWETKYWQPVKTVTLRGRTERRWPLTRTGRMQFSPDGQWFAAWGHAGLNAVSKGEVVIWKVSDIVPKPDGSMAAEAR